MANQQQARIDITRIYEAGLKAVSGDEAVYQALMRQGEQSESHVIAIGKAAEAMYQGAQRYLEKGIKSVLLISKYQHFSQEILANRRIKALEASHPVPAASSLQAGQALLDYLCALPQGEPCLFLISGGASSLCEVLAPGWELPRLQALTERLLSDGYDIHTMNAIRQRVSQIKGGKLWAYIGERSVNSLLISDVPGDHPESIGSGLLFPPQQDSLLMPLPAALQASLPVAQAITRPNDFKWQIVASNQLALTAMAAQAQALGYKVKVSPDLLVGDAERCAKNCVAQMEAGESGVYLWGGETTVCLPANAGKGGRNQHFALAAALAMNEGDGLTLLAAGTDGSDGDTSYAGACVDGSLPEDPHGRFTALDVQDALRRADATTVLELTNSLIATGPTGTNVMDVVIGLKQ